MSGQMSFAGFDPPREGAAPHPGPVFFALRPDRTEAARLAELASRIRAEAKLHGDIIEPRFHVSLLAIGHLPALPDRQIDAARRAASTIRMPAFPITFDHVSGFGVGGRTIVLEVPGQDGPLWALFRSLGMALKRAGVPTEMSRPFKPHLTLIYADRPLSKQPIAPVGWTVRSFALIHSHHGRSHHEVIGEWPFGEAS